MKNKIDIMKRIAVLMLTVVMSAFVLVGCSGGYETISASEAKAIMDSKTNYVILDVRTADEYADKHIAGAILIPHDKIEDKAEDILIDKNQLILVYCRSGNRSKIACDTLVKLGYKNVKNFGGINDWTYGTVSE